ncbi:MAG: hypothetical protein ABIQ64_04045 [Candidatus Saccharimonadales bacterium]
MLYIWWIFLVLILGVLLSSLTLPIAAGQYRLQAFGRLCQYVSVALLVIVLGQLYDPFVTIISSVFLFVVILFVAHIAVVRRTMVAFIRPHMTRVVRFVSRVTIFEYLSDKRTLSDKVGVSSYDELLSIIHGASFIPETHRRNIVSYIPLLESTVRDYMRPIDDILAIQEDEVIGPLLLDELHSSGQHSFLVIAPSGQIKGTVKLTQLTESSKDVTKVQDIMDRHIVHISSEASMQDAFQSLVREQAWLGVVTNTQEPSVVSLQDIAGALLGKVPR